MRLFPLRLATIGFLEIGRSIYAVPVPELIIVDIYSLQKEPIYQNDHNIILEVIPYRALAAPMLYSVPEKVIIIKQYCTWKPCACSHYRSRSKDCPTSCARSDFTKAPL